MRRKKSITEKVNTAAAYIACISAALLFTVGAFWFGDGHPVTVALMLIAITSAGVEILTGGMIDGR